MLKHEKKIVIWNEKLRRVRNSFRDIFVLALFDEIEILQNFDNLYEDWSNLTPEEEKESAILQAKITNLFSLLSKSICSCPLCTNSDNDMVYIPDHGIWYCVECQEKRLIWDPSKGSEEDRRQNDYANWYLGQKDKLTKRFLSKERSDLEK